MKDKFISISLDIYRCHVIVTWESNPDKIMAWAKKHGVKEFQKDWKEVFKDNSDKANGITIELGKNNNDVLIWLKEKPEKLSQFGTLYHELYHATDQVAINHAMDFTKEIEGRAYIFEYLANQCNLILWTIKKSKN